MENLELIAGLLGMAIGIVGLTWGVVDAWRSRDHGEVEVDFTGEYLSNHPNKDRSWQ